MLCMRVCHYVPQLSKILIIIIKKYSNISGNVIQYELHNDKEMLKIIVLGYRVHMHL